jgi:hypothetical protein
MKNGYRIFLIFLTLTGILLLLSPPSGATEGEMPGQGSDPGKKDIVMIDNPYLKKEEKDALLILPGLDIRSRGRRKMEKYFSDCGYDVYIPDFKVRKSMELAVENVEEFFFTHELGEYRELHVVSYILGSWVLNQFIERKGMQNITSIVYDRSPLQERAPRVVIEKIPWAGWIVVGPILRDLDAMPFPSVEKGETKIGIMVESKATSLIRFFKKKTLSYGPIPWDKPDLNLEYDDLIYVPFNHDEMYLNFDHTGPEILHFHKQGKFSSDARRNPYEWNYFKQHKESEW